ncbi:hypothetical protein HF325_001142 [Metschnikowia pulcherrima]|uniref:Rab GDP dissociation inhibitor n=1 Tax=Metschnikowia pulcherrima TaxID=27326 RepID=A0A8H7GW91_9ASCO|nr:hypothetical protein HF325_001142 [Metschnikowia pulcherrima]
MEALRSSLMGIFEKRRMKRFLEFVAGYDEDESSTHQGLNLDQNTMEEVYSHFGLERGTKDFIGHAMALWANDDYLVEAARPTIERIILYVQSVAKYGKSPYIYPLYGLGELPQGFARLSAIYGGTYMLDTPIDEVLYDEEKHFKGVVTKEGVAHAPIVIADPTYFPDRVKKTGHKDGSSDNVFISKSYDPSSHFETTTDDIKDLYFRITGKPLVLKKRTTDEELNLI